LLVEKRLYADFRAKRGATDYLPTSARYGMVCNPKAKEDRQAAYIFRGKIVGAGALKEHYEWLCGDLSIRLATVAKIDLQEIAFATADLGTGLHLAMLRSGRHRAQRPLKGTAALMRTFVVLAPWDAPRHPFQMTSPPNGSDYLIGRFFVGLLALVATVILISIAWEVSSGVVHHRTGGVSVRANDPKGFWIDIAVQFALAVFFGWQAYRLRQFAHRT
jgi:hypothetical protein